MYLFSFLLLQAFDVAAKRLRLASEEAKAVELVEKLNAKLVEVKKEHDDVKTLGRSVRGQPEACRRSQEMGRMEPGK